MTTSENIGNLIDIELEQIVLGAIVLESGILSEINEYLNPDYFSLSSHRYVAEAINDLQAKSEPIDMISIVAQMRTNNTLVKSGGAAFVPSLTNRVASTSHTEYHFRSLQEKYMRRLMREEAQRTISALDSGVDTMDIVEKRQKYGENIEVVTKSDVKFDKNTYPDYFEQRDQKIKKNNGITGIPSGYLELDRLTGGWQRQDLIIIAARPAMGKTTLAINEFALNAALDFGLPTAVFSMEMSGNQIMDKALSNRSGIPLNNILRVGLNEMDLKIARAIKKQLIDAPLYIDDTPALTVFDLRTKARKLKRRNGIELIVVDYMQLMQGIQKGNREQEISSISRGLKSIAKELDIPIIALSQLSRSVETRGGDKRPMLSDLRDSGAIEQDADMVAFVYRPEYYGILEDSDGMSTHQVAEFIVAKHRNGGLDEINLKFIKEKGIFEEWISNTKQQHDPGQHEKPWWRSPMPQNDEFDQQ